MFAYYLRLGLRNMRRSPALTFLIVITLAVGVSASMSTLTVLYMMSGDPIPQKSDRLLTPRINNYPTDGIADTEEPPNLLSWTDVRNLRASGFGVRRTGLYGISGIVYPERDGMKNFFADGAAVDADFFAMMDVPFLHGSAWGHNEDRDEARVVVISRRLSDKLFGHDDPVGRTLRIDNQQYRIIGVLDRWVPTPKFYRLDGQSSSGAEEDEVFMPLSTALAEQRGVNGSTSCYSDAGPGFSGLMESECVWLRFWFELSSAGERSALEESLRAYVQQQRALGRLPRPSGAALFNVREWLQALEVVDDDTRLQTLLAFGFLCVCLVNTIGLLLAKFTARSGEIGVRRALGATRGQIFAQFIGEAMVLGVVGSLIGLAGAFGMLELLSGQSPDLERYARMDGLMLFATVAASVAAATLAGLLPTWRATHVVPAVQLKSQ